MITKLDLIKFKRTLKQHPGVPIASVLSVAGGVAGYRPDNPAMILFGFIFMSLFCWTPVLITAWVDRE